MPVSSISDDDREEFKSYRTCEHGVSLHFPNGEPEEAKHLTYLDDLQAWLVDSWEDVVTGLKSPLPG